MYVKNTFTYKRQYGIEYSSSVKKPSKKPAAKLKITLSLSRSILAALDRISAKRVEKGASRRDVQHSILVEEAVELLKRKEEL